MADGNVPGDRVLRHRGQGLCEDQHSNRPQPRGRLRQPHFGRLRQPNQSVRGARFDHGTIDHWRLSSGWIDQYGFIVGQSAPERTGDICEYYSAVRSDKWRCEDDESGCSRDLDKRKRPPASATTLHDRDNRKRRGKPRPMNTTQNHTRSAFTLVETITAMACGTIVLVALLAMSISLQRSFAAVEGYSIAEGDQLRVQDYIAMDCRRATG